MSLVPFCLSPDDEQHFLAVFINQKQPGALCFALYQCTVAPTAGHLVGRRSSGDHMKNRPAAEGVHETLPKDMCFHAAQRSDLSSLSGVQSTKKPGLQIQTQAHHQCSVKEVKREPCSPKQGTMLGWKLKARGLT